MSRSEEETLRFGANLAAELRGGESVFVSGPLGAGKSILVRGIAECLGVRDWRGSPTFTIVNEYDTEPPLYHMDLYRLTECEVEDLGLEDYARPDAILAVEWPERAPTVLTRLSDRFIHVDIVPVSFCEREIRFSCNLGGAPESTLEPGHSA